MAKAGRPAQPTNLKLLKGETRPSRVNRNEPKPPPEDVAPPEYLDDEAVAVWNRYAPTLKQRGLLTPWDVDSFAVFCTAVVHHARAVRIVNSSNVVVKAPGANNIVKNPASQLVRDYAQLIATFGAKFGLSPADRAHITIPEAADDNDHQRKAKAVLD